MIKMKSKVNSKILKIFVVLAIVFINISISKSVAPTCAQIGESCSASIPCCSGLTCDPTNAICVTGQIKNCDCDAGDYAGDPCTYCDTSANCDTSTGHTGLTSYYPSSTPCGTNTITCSSFCQGNVLKTPITSTASCTQYCTGSGTCGSCTPTCNYATTVCSGDTPLCDSSTSSCVECISSTDCSDRSCMIKQCSGNICKYTWDTSDPSCTIVADAGPDRVACKDYPIKLDGSGSRGFIDEYYWYGGGISEYGKIIQHTFTSTGVYTINLKVKNTTLIIEDTDDAQVNVIEPPSTGCQYCAGILELSKNRACGNDTILAQIYNLQNCKDAVVKLKIGSTELCEVKSFNQTAICAFRTPDIPQGVYHIQTYVGGALTPITTTLEINERPDDLGICYDYLGRQTDCIDTCSDKIPLQRWKDVAGISIPLHFSFASKRENVQISPTSSINCGNPTYRNFTYGMNCYGGSAPNGPNCDCPKCEDQTIFCLPDTTNKENLVRWLWSNYSDIIDNMAKYYRCEDGKAVTGCYQHQSDYSQGCDNNYCEYNTHRISRYTYNWKFSYDMAPSILSTTDIIPMFVGEDLQPIGEATQQILGGCEGEGVLCYTEIPICGDGICSYDSGERCWNCPQDCGESADGTLPEFIGSCSNLGCSRCPTTDSTFSDPRGCVIKWKERNEEATCSEMCKPGLKYVTEQYNNPEETIVENKVNTNPKVPGVCCNPSELWNEEKQKCETPRSVLIEAIQVEFKRGGGYDTYWCCVGREDVGFVKISITIKNYGNLPETGKIKVDLGTEKDNDFITGEPYSWLQEASFELAPENSVTKTFIWDCVRTSMRYCYAFIDCDSPGDCTFGEGEDYHPYLQIQIIPDDMEKSDIYGIPSSIYGLYDSHVLCDTYMRFCDNGDSITDVGGDSYSVLCGGTDKWDLIPTPSVWPADCNPFN